MEDFNTVQLVVGVFVCIILAISSAFIVYWHTIAKKHLILPDQKPQKIHLAEKAGFQLSVANFQHT